MKPNYSCHLEKALGEALGKAGIQFVHESQKGNRNKAIDFYLPDLDVYIEVKQYHTERVGDQLTRHENIILLQGKKAVAAFIKLTRDMSNEKQAQELTGHTEEAKHTPEEYRIEVAENNLCLNLIARRDNERPIIAKIYGETEQEVKETAELFKSAPSLKAENERLREANRVMLDALKRAKKVINDSYLNPLDASMVHDEVELIDAAISIGEVRQGAKE